jgi:hypothetical protein
MTNLITVIYETDKAVFRFSVEDVMDHLNRNETEYDEKEATALKELLSSAAGDSITMPKDLGFFSHIALNLITEIKGTAYCRICRKTYESGQLKAEAVRHGETPLSVNVKRKGWLRKIFGKRERLPLFGGRGYACPQGHELIGVVTWRT